MTNRESDRRDREKGQGSRSISPVGMTTMVSGVAIAAVVMAGAVKSLSNGETGLGWVLFAGALLVCTGPVIKVFRSRNR